MEALTLTAWLRWDRIRPLLPGDARTVLEIGAGLGGTGAMLSRRYAYTGLEPDPIAYSIAARRNPGRVLQQRVEDHEGMYDLVCAFEVLEHIEDDLQALRDWYSHSRKWLLLSVPMDPDRFGPADEHVGHYRRYTRATLATALSETGWSPGAIHAYGFPAGYVLDAARQRLAARIERQPDSMMERTHASGRWLQPRDAFAPVTWAAGLPLRLLQRPFGDSDLGTGLIALARRAGTDVVASRTHR
jgi:SAM-dependent methyltransferase